jgi:hypothetical protein
MKHDESTQPNEIVNDIYAIVKEVGQHKTILKCVIDQKLRIYQDRIFDNQMLSKVVTLSKGQLILIKQRQGMRGNEYHNLLSFSDGTGLIENAEEFFGLGPDTDLKQTNKVWNEHKGG